MTTVVTQPATLCFWFTTSYSPALHHEKDSAHHPPHLCSAIQPLEMFTFKTQDQNANRRWLVDEVSRVLQDKARLKTYPSPIDDVFSEVSDSNDHDSTQWKAMTDLLQIASTHMPRGCHLFRRPDRVIDCFRSHPARDKGCGESLCNDCRFKQRSENAPNVNAHVYTAPSDSGACVYPGAR